MTGTLLASFVAIIFVSVISVGHSHPRNLVTRDKFSIVGGHNVSIEDYPYQTYVIIETASGKYACGGSIISENYVLSAAHCFRKKSSKIEIRAGSSLYNENYTSISVSEVIVHPSFSELDHDVALMKTSSPIQFTKSIKPIKLPNKGRPMVKDSMMTVSGWGRTEEFGPISPYLLAVDVPIVQVDTCKKIYKGLNIHITENMWCAGYLGTGGKDACSGDSGGAAVQDNMVVGIVSFGEGCADPDYPGVYTNVAAPAIRDFIAKHTGL